VLNSLLALVALAVTRELHQQSGNDPARSEQMEAVTFRFATQAARQVPAGEGQQSAKAEVTGSTRMLAVSQKRH
jgi:hypothetical protein